ncbi:hypothetical protein [Dongia sp.]|uniref:hypothetical protein n=1 Tax=Dongia sp. TaxID=1977262 RepID=UPI00375283AB
MNEDRVPWTAALLRRLAHALMLVAALATAIALPLHTMGIEHAIEHLQETQSASAAGYDQNGAGGDFEATSHDSLSGCHVIAAAHVALAFPSCDRGKARASTSDQSWRSANAISLQRPPIS